LHCSVQAALQQTPSAQKPLVHSLAAEQTVPAAFFAWQLWFAAQYEPLTHSESEEHDVAQTDPLQRKGAHENGAGV
jgi:hypothetical protein